MFETAMEEKMNPTKLCSTCGDELILEVASYPMGSAFLKHRFHVDIYRCPKCNRVKLFAAKSQLVTCPVCGSTHHAGERCVICALNTAFDGKHGKASEEAASPSTSHARGETLMDRIRHNYEEEKEQVVETYLELCPICGNYHSINEGCTQCDLDSKASGIQAPELTEQKETPIGATGVGQVEAGFLQDPPLSVLAAASAEGVVSPKELEKTLAEAGIEVPEKPKKEKKHKEPKEHGPSGVDSIEGGFLAEPEMSIVEELGAIKYAAAPKEIDEDIKKVEDTYGEEDDSLPLNDALLAKLREAGFTGDLEALKKMADGTK